ncbi:MAG: hypothetical protein NVV74_15270 [Magnetospirillum sp.]|nr:hypothetical protein [Magnetospirillum sp.]
MVAQASGYTRVNVSIPVYADADVPTLVLDGGVAGVVHIIEEDDLLVLDSSVVDAALGEPSVNGWQSSDQSETLTIRIRPVEQGERLLLNDTEQALKPGGYWEVSAKDILDGKVSIGGIANWATSGNDRLHFDVMAVATESEQASSTVDQKLLDAGLTSAADPRALQADSGWQTLTLQVTPKADKVTLTATATGDEDTAIAFEPRIQLKDLDGSETVADVTITSTDPDLINGKLIFNGVERVPEHNADGSYTWTFSAGELTPTTAGSKTDFTLKGLVFQPAAHSAGDVGENHNTTITVITQDSNGDTMPTTADVSIDILKVADAPIVTVGGSAAAGQTVHLSEDLVGMLNLDARLVDGAAPDPETLSSAQLSGVPEGWMVGYRAPDGLWTAASVVSKEGGFVTYTIDPARIGQVAVRGPSNLHVSAADAPTLTFTATSSETGTTGILAGHESASTSLSFKLAIDAVADAPNLLVTHARTFEDTAVRLDIRALLTDTDQSEAIGAVYIKGSAGATYWDSADVHWDAQSQSWTGSAHAVGVRGTLAADGTWTDDPNGLDYKFTAGQLGSLFLLPKHDSNVDLVGNDALTVVAQSVEGSNGSHAETSASLQVLITGVSDGVVIDAGYVDANGRLIAHGVEDQAVDGSAHAGAVIDPGFGHYHAVDTDGSETLSIVLRDVPANVGVEMVAGYEKYLRYIGRDADGNTQWAIDPTDDALSKVRFTTPANYAGKFDVELELITTEDDGASASSLRTLTVDVAAVTDKPSLSLSGSGTEDQGAPVAFTIQTNPADTTSESPEHISQITINIDVPAGIPAGTLKLHLGGEVVTVDGGVEFTIKPGDALWSNYDPATGKLTGLSLEGLPNGWSRDIPVTVTATSVEDIDGTAAPATNTVTGKIVIEARADAPTWSLDAAGGGTVDHPVSLDLSATLNDPDGSESIYFIVEDVPDGVILNHGYNNGDGTWTVPYTPGVPGWSLTATSHYTGQAALKVTAVVVDHDPDGGADTKVSEAKTFNLTITDPGGTGGGEWSALNPVAPTLAGDPQAGTEDVPFGLGGVAASGGTGNDALSALVVVDLPAGAQVVGTTDGNGAAIAWYNPITGHWTVDPNHLADFKVVADEDASGPVFLDIRAATLNGGATTGHVNVVDLAPVTDGGSFSMAPVGPVAEDSPKVPVTLTLTQADDDHSESLATDQVTIKNLTPGAKLYYDSGNGPVLLTADGDGTYHLPIPGITGKASTTLSGLYVEPPAQFSGKVSFTVGTVFQEAGSALQVPVSQTFSINVAPVVDTPTITVADHTGAEDSAISLHATINAPDVIGAGQYGSEYLSVIIGGVPDGAGVLGATYNNDHTWTVKSGNIELVNGQATLKNVSIVPPQDYSGTIHLSIKTYTLESSDRGLGAQSDYATFDLHVTGVADVPTANPVGRAGDEDAVVALDFDAELIDTSETISVIVRGVPTDATRAGAPFVEVDEDGAPVRDAHGDYIPVGVEIQVDANGDPLLDPATHLPLAVTGATHTGVWWIAAADVAKVGFMGPVDVSGTIAMTVQTMSQDDDSVALGNRMPFTVRLDGVADTPTLTIADLAPADDATQAAGTEDGDIAVGIAALVTDVTNDGPDGETVEVLITGAPAGTLFVTAAGQTIGVESDGWWHIPSAALDGLAVRPPADYDQDFTLRVVAKTTEGDTTAVSAEQTLAVHVAAENDAATGRVIGAPGWSVTAGQWDEPLRVIPDGDGSGASFDITDVDGSGLSKVEVAIGSAKAGDTLGLEGVGVVRDGQGHLVVQGTDIQVSYDAATHTLTFTGAASHAQYEALVEKVILSTTNTSGALAAGNRSIGITLYDDAVPPTASTVTTNANVAAGSFLSAAALGTVAWNADGTIHNFAEGGTLSASGGSGIEDVPLKLTLDAALADGSEKGFVILGDLPDGAVLVNGQGAAIGMEVQVQNGQVVLDANHNPVAATTHTGVWAVSVGQAGNVYFQGAHDQAGSWTLTAQVLTIDGASTQAGPVSTLQVALADDAPHLAATGTAQDPVTGDSHGVVAEPVHVLPDDATLTVADVNGTMLSGMRIEIAAGPAHSGDGLGLSGHDIALDANGHFVIDGTDIQVSYENGVLSFNGDASTATYADLAKSVVLANGGPLVAGDRTFGITLFDEQHQASNLLTTTVTIDDSAKTLSPEAQGDVTFNASGSAVLNCGDGDDTVHMHAGLAYDTVNGNGGTDTLMMDIGTGQPGDWVFLVDGSDLTLVAATDHSQTLGVIHIDTPGAVPAGIDGHTVDGVVFNGSVNGTIEFTDHSVVAFHNIEKLGAG